MRNYLYMNNFHKIKFCILIIEIGWNIIVSSYFFIIYYADIFINKSDISFAKVLLQINFKDLQIKT